MANDFFRFKEFTINQQNCPMKVGTDGVLIGAWTDIVNVSSILDIGTGTGLIAIMLAQKTTVPIDAIDINEVACIQAKENVINSPWKENIHIYHKSLQDFSINTKIKYDLIVTNPPYFNNSLKTSDEGRNLARHNDTLTFNDILLGIKKLLTISGRFVIILPYINAQLFIVEAAMQHLYCNKKLLIKTISKNKPTRILMEFEGTRKKITENELVIYSSENEYSIDYKNLTGNYYLNF